MAEGTLGSQQQENVPEVQVTANPETVGYSYWAPRTNSALQLADALSELRPQAGEAMQVIAAHQQQRAEEETKQAAIKTAGADFAEAVRKGLIEPTQNPWWIQAYQRNSAQVRTQNEVAKLNADAATWSEQNDPAAFQQKYAAALSKIGEGYHEQDAQEGYNAAAAPALQQAVAANQAYNVERIKTERQQDLSSLVGKAVQDSIRTNGGRADPALIQKAIAPLRQEWLSTGGTVTDWNGKVMVGAVADAAFVMKNPGIIDLAKKLPNNAGGSLYDMTGVARDLEQARYRIMGENRDVARLGMQANEYNQYMKTQQLEGVLLKQYGPDIYSGKMDFEKALQFATSQGYNAAEVAGTFRSIAQTANSIRELAADRTGAWEASRAGSLALNEMYGEAQRNGWSEGLENSIGYHLLHNDISDQTAIDIRSRALARTRAVATTNPSAQAAGERLRGRIIENWQNARDNAVTAAAKAEAVAVQHGASALSPDEQAALQSSTVDAVSEFLEANPKGFSHAREIAARAAAEWVLQRQQLQQGAPTSGGALAAPSALPPMPHAAAKRSVTQGRQDQSPLTLRELEDLWDMSLNSAIGAVSLDPTALKTAGVAAVRAAQDWHSQREQKRGR